VPLGQDIRLASLLILNAPILGALVYAARRWTRDPLQRLIDVLLLWYLVQYLAVCLPGLVHCLSAISMSITAMVMAGVVVWSARRHESLSLDENRADHAKLLFATLFFVGYLAMLVGVQTLLPVTDSDGMTYHVPAAVQWMHTGRLALLPVWFFNPANTFSPLAGSSFIFWLMAPLRSDALFRFVQLPATLLLFAGMVQLGRMMGVRTGPAIVCAMVAGSRLACSEIMAPRDDLFLAAFILVAMAGCGRNAMQDRFGPWRLGIALGLALATKYTALISLPLILLLWCAPRRAGWTKQHWLIALGALTALAGPWYLRNLLLTGNPIYPMRITLFGHTLLPGMLVTRTSLRLRVLAETKKALIGGYHGVPIPLLIFMGIGYIAALVVCRRRFREPLVRACLLGPLLCIAVFFAKAPYGEVRFLYPSFFVMCVATGLVAAIWKLSEWQQALVCLPLAAAAFYTSYILLDVVCWAVAIGLLLGSAGLGFAWLGREFPAWRTRMFLGLTTAMVLALGFWIYVEWNVYVGVCHLDEVPIWQTEWPGESPAWHFLQEHVPKDTVIAYTQTFLIYPLIGDDLERRVVYVPVRADTPDFLHHPAFPRPMDGESIQDEAAVLLNAPGDQTIWRRRLAASGAKYLFVCLNGVVKRPTESIWAEADKQHFVPIFKDESAAIYQIQL
jgi:hypothetical protein